MVIPTQIRDTVLNSVHPTHPGTNAMLDIAEDIWFPHIQRGIVAVGENGKECKEQGKSFQSVLGKRHHAELEGVEPNEEVQLDIAGPMPDDLNKDAYILVAIDIFSKNPTTKVVTKTTAGSAINFMQNYIMKTKFQEGLGVTYYNHNGLKN